MDIESKMAREISKGDTVRFEECEGYVLHQDRPFKCRYQCECGSCDGTWVLRTGVIEHISRYSDDVEVTIIDAQGRTYVKPITYLARGEQS